MKTNSPILNKTYIEKNNTLCQYIIRQLYNMVYVYIWEMNNISCSTLSAPHLFYKIKYEVYVKIPYTSIVYIRKNIVDNNDKPYIITEEDNNKNNLTEVGFTTTPKQTILQIKKFFVNLINQQDNENSKKTIKTFYKQLHRDIINKLPKENFIIRNCNITQ